MPKRNISPLSGFSTPEMIFINVVLPAPLWPKRQNISDGNKLHLKSSTANKSPNDFDILWIVKHFFDIKY